MNNKYYKTKFCNTFIEKGVCLNNVDCCYAHSLDEIRHVKCNYYKSCNKVDCKFIHNNENYFSSNDN